MWAVILGQLWDGEKNEGTAEMRSGASYSEISNAENRNALQRKRETVLK